jgi:hypothetical protein
LHISGFFVGIINPHMPCIFRCMRLRRSLALQRHCFKKSKTAWYNVFLQVPSAFIIYRQLFVFYVNCLKYVTTTFTSQKGSQNPDIRYKTRLARLDVTLRRKRGAFYCLYAY